MSQTVITQAFEALKAQEAANGGVLTLDEFVFASVPNLNITDPIDRNEGLPAEAQIVHRQAVSKTGMVNNNSVVYSVVLGADVGDFEFNWVGLLNKDSGVVAMIVHAPSQKKIRTQSGQQGNVLTRSFLMEYNGASQQTQIITPADTWQIDFTARLNGVDERIRHENKDTYGAASFLKDGFLVSGTNGSYQVKKGVAYIEGLRAELLFDQAVTVATRPSKIWVDVCMRGTLTSVWEPATKVTVADYLVDYVTGDEQHYVFAIADIKADGSVIDLRQSSVLAQFGGLSAEPNVVPFFDKDSVLKKTALSNFIRQMLAIPDATGVLSQIGLSGKGGAGLIADTFKPVTWSEFADGADSKGDEDSSEALIAVYTAAEKGIGIIIPKGIYKEGSETKEVRSDSLWLGRDFGSGVGILTEARKTPLLITVGNPDEPVLSSEHTRSGINITAIGRGGQHIDCIRATTINYSTDGNGNTAIYASAISLPGSKWTAALHGEIKHQGNSTIAVSAEAASYSDKGTFYGAVLNNTTGTAAENHPTTGAPAILHPSATALYITGSNQRGEMGQWIRGIRFSPLSMRETGTLVRDESACAQGWWSQPSSSKTTADIFLEGTAPVGAIFQGNYATGNAIRLAAGDAIAYESTGAIKTKYDKPSQRWGIFNGALEKVSFDTVSPGLYFNGVKVLDKRQPAIPDAVPGTEIATINAILNTIRNHGQIYS